MLVSGVQESDSAIYIYMHIIYIIYIFVLFQILFHYRLLQDIEYSCLCYIVGPCCLSILYMVVCICLVFLKFIFGCVGSSLLHAGFL